MVKFKQIRRALEEGLKTNDYSELLDLIRSEPSCVKKKFENQQSLLHYLCSINVASINLQTEMNDDDEEKPLIDEDTYIEMLEQVINEFNCPLNSTDAGGNSPLHYAVAKGNDRVVDSLLANSEIIIDIPITRGYSFDASEP